MKKILASVCAVAFAATLFVVPAKADNSEEVIIGVLGGALGGLIVGEALARPRYAPAPVYVVPPPVYAPAPVYIEPEYVRQCWWKKYRRYDPALGYYVKVKRKVCDWVPAY
jgi:hypothetical protein